MRSVQKFKTAHNTVADILGRTIFAIGNIAYVSSIKVHDYACDTGSHKIISGDFIIDTETNILDIPVDVIQALKPTKIVFIKASPDIILTMRANDNSRGRLTLSGGQIEEQQNRALKQVEEYI